VTVLSTSVSMIVLAAALSVPQAGPHPQTFDLVATASPNAAAKGGITVAMTVQLDRYTPEHELKTMTDGLKYDGYKGFLNALREAPRVGTLDVAGQTFGIRWAREVPNANGRIISLVTDQPVFFVGGGRKDAKPKGGYEVAVIQLVLDASGKGTGTMAAAARVKPGGETGVRIDNYAEKPVQLTATAHPAK
jgi:hypothetical protein